MAYIAKMARRTQTAEAADFPLVMTWAVAGLVLTAAMALCATPAAMLMITG